MRIVIAGAGIGGLTAALSLHRAGWRDIVVLERSAEIRGLGVGINLLPHALRDLTELGIASRVRALGFEPHRLIYLSRHGQEIWSEPRGTAAGYRWPQVSVHRGRLQQELLRTVRERLGDVIRLDHRLVDVREEANRAVVVVNVAGDHHELAAEVVIGADGIHSALRALRYPAEGGPSWNGLTLWRGIARVRPFLDGRTMIMVGDGDQKLVAYPLGEAEGDGLQTVNFIAERRGEGFATSDWNRVVPTAPVIDHFRDWQFEWLDVPALIGAASEILEYPMVDREALPRWSFGRTTLLGDAAHALYPNGSNGGSQAILDAQELARRLGSTDDVHRDLAAYEAARRPVTARLLELTRQTGPEKVMLLAAERAPLGFENIDDVIPLAERQAIAHEYKLAAGFDHTALNSDSSP